MELPDDFVEISFTVYREGDSFFLCAHLSPDGEHYLDLDVCKKCGEDFTDSELALLKKTFWRVFGHGLHYGLSHPKEPGVN